MSIQSLADLEKNIRSRNKSMKIITGHTGWSDSLDFVFAHTDQICHDAKKQKPVDPNAPYDGYDEEDDTMQLAKTQRLAKADLGRENILNDEGIQSK